MTNLVAIKGSRDGLRLQLDEAAGWPELFDALGEQLSQGAQFFNGARVTIDIGERDLDEAQLGALLELMRQHHLEPSSLTSTSRASRNAARAAGVVARPVTRAATVADDRSEAFFMKRTIRSGQIIRHHGNITILGDLNAGGEIIAGGSVVVWGRLRGTVHAGALGDRDAVICALDLNPTQLRIADLITRPPDDATRYQPEIARIIDDQIVVEAWNQQRHSL
ncbi:MAG TPA: septum site-determining protein MinC [Roseiflexaceae bacterium]|nr:septum site-determining protein MinC [Roseiflexaceae bacterium]HMP40668.1 septum site-determining protein MinC [Roseiflexaceae bacterium]